MGFSGDGWGSANLDGSEVCEDCCLHLRRQAVTRWIEFFALLRLKSVYLRGRGSGETTPIPLSLSVSPFIVLFVIALFSHFLR